LQSNIELLTEQQDILYANASQSLLLIFQAMDAAGKERYLTQNGTVVLKFFLNVSRKEQKKRFLKRKRIGSFRLPIFENANSGISP
jgi:polyphosphate kinase 2 (PPK2 family)